MRKGIVMEQKKGYTIVMTHDGNFHRALRLYEAEVGMEVHFQAISNNKHLRPLGWLSNIVPWKAGIIALVLVLACLPFYVKYGSSQAYAYVNIDINPSLELKLNDQMQVIQITPRNEDAEKLMDMLTDWKKKDVSEVAFEMINISQENGWMNQQKQVLIGISYLKTEPTANLAKRMEHELSDRVKDLSVSAYNLPISLRKQALEANQSVNEWVAKQLSEKQSDTKGANSIDLISKEKEMIQSFFEESSKIESSENNSSSNSKNIEAHGEEPSTTTEDLKKDKKSVNSKENKNVNNSSDSSPSSSGDQRGSTGEKNKDTKNPPLSNMKKDESETVDQKVNSEDESSKEKKEDEPKSNSGQSQDKPDKESSKDKKKEKPKSNSGQSKEKPAKDSSEDKKKDKPKSNSGQS
ncbi:Anti-sigma factor N-terminus, partial [Halobacillus alkaliphilus]